MAQRATTAAFLTLVLAAATLRAQTDTSQSPVPGAGFDPSPATSSTPAPTSAPTAATRAGNTLPSGATAPTIHVYSRETILDVLVTDEKGQPVRGLTRDDFTVEEDSKPMPLRGFSENSVSAPTPPPALPPNTYTNDNKLPTGGPVQIFLFDLIGSPPDEMERASKYIADYLRTMPAGTQVVLFGLYPREQLVLLHDFTTNGPSAATTVDKLNVEWIHDPVDGIPILIAGMNQIAAYVANIHGRKNLIWIVPGMPLKITRDGGYAGLGPPPDRTRVNQLMDLYDIFTREQIAVYPLDPRGVHGLGIGTLNAEEVAEATGGTTDNTNDYKGELTKVVDQSSHFYTLSYVPPRPQEDGHFHPIKISVDRPGVHLTYRTGYNDEQPSQPDAMLTHDMIQGPMRTGALPATQLIFTLQVMPAPAGTKDDLVHITDKSHVGSAKDHLYNAAFRFDPTQIAFSETPGGKRTAKLEFDLAAFDNFSQLGPVRSQVITLSVNASGYNDFMRKPFEFTLPIPIPAGQQTLRAGLFDTVGNKSGTLQVPLNVPKH